MKLAELYIIGCLPSLPLDLVNFSFAMFMLQDSFRYHHTFIVLGCRALFASYTSYSCTVSACILSYPIQDVNVQLVSRVPRYFLEG